MRHAPATRNNSWEDVADLSASLGVPLDEWQEQVMEAAMGERSDGRWAARIVGLSTPRQNGKSQLIVSRALAGILLFNEETILISAHQTDTAREVFQRLLDIIEDNPSLERRVDSVMKAINREHIRFKGGQSIRIKARSAPGSRGFSADCLLLDEAQILSSAAWSSILPTMSARENPQAWLLGTPPTPVDDGEVFGRIRSQAIEGRAARTAYLEWSAEPDDDFDDPVVWAKANPAYGFRISAEAVEAERSAMSSEQFAMERLGVWQAVNPDAVIDPDAWLKVTDGKSVAVDRLALAVDIGPTRDAASIAVAGQRVDGDWHVELVEQFDDMDKIIDRVVEITEKNDKVRAVIIDAAGAAASLIDELQERKVRVIVTQARDMAAACGQLHDLVESERVRHIGQAPLTAALMSARKRPLGDAWAWSRKTSTADITPIVACTLALWGAQNSKAKPRSNRAMFF